MNRVLGTCLSPFLLYCISSCSPKRQGLEYVNPRVFDVDLTFELRPDLKTIDREHDLKLWLPAPKEWDSQKAVRIISVDPPPQAEYTDPEFGNRMFSWDFGKEPEKPVYSVNLKYRLESLDLGTEIDPKRVGTYDTTSDLYNLYTRSTRHIEISPEIIALAREAVGEEENPYRQAKRIHDFVVRKVRFRLFRPDKVAGTRALLETAATDEQTGEEYYEGACNLQAEFFVALCRAVGIPARAVTGMVGWGPWVGEEGLKLRDQRYRQLSRDGLATARLFGPLDGHRWAEFYLPNYGWIPTDPTWDRFARIGNRRFILSKGTDVLIGPEAPPDDGDGYGDQRILLHDGRVDAFGLGVWNLARIRVANAKFLHHTDPFPAGAFSVYPAVPAEHTPSVVEAPFDGRALLRDIDGFTRNASDKQGALAAAYDQEPWLQEQHEAFVIHMLRGIVGDESFVRIRDAYLALRRTSGEAVPTRRFQDIAEEIHGEPLEWFFRQWLQSKELPELKLDNVKIEKGEEGWLVQGDLRQANDRAFRFPVDLEIVSAGAATHKRVWIDRREAPFQFTTEDKPDRIIVDPDFDVLKIQKMPPALTTGYPNVLLVYGTLAEGEANRAAAEKFDRGFLGLGGEVIKADAEVRNEDLSTPVVILFGRPETNLIAQRLAGDFPVTFDGPTFTYGGVTYEKPTQGVAQLSSESSLTPSALTAATT